MKCHFTPSLLVTTFQEIRIEIHVTENITPDK